MTSKELKRSISPPLSSPRLLPRLSPRLSRKSKSMNLTHLSKNSEKIKKLTINAL